MNTVLVVGAPAPNFSIIIAINALAVIRINACSFPPTLTILLDPSSRNVEYRGASANEWQRLAPGPSASMPPTPTFESAPPAPPQSIRGRQDSSQFQTSSHPPAVLRFWNGIATRPDNYQYPRSVSAGSAALLHNRQPSQAPSQGQRARAQYTHLPGASAPYASMTRAAQPQYSHLPGASAPYATMNRAETYTPPKSASTRTGAGARSMGRSATGGGGEASTASRVFVPAATSNAAQSSASAAGVNPKRLSADNLPGNWELYAAFSTPRPFGFECAFRAREREELGLGDVDLGGTKKWWNERPNPLFPSFARSISTATPLTPILVCGSTSGVCTRAATTDPIHAYARASERDPNNPVITQRLALLKNAQATVDKPASGIPHRLARPSDGDLASPAVASRWAWSAASALAADVPLHTSRAARESRRSVLSPLCFRSAQAFLKLYHLPQETSVPSWHLKIQDPVTPASTRPRPQNSPQRLREAQIHALRREGILLEEEYREEIRHYMHDLEHYQLVGCAALWIAAKFEDAKEHVPIVQDLAQICRDTYDESAFIQMEGHVMCTIQWTLGHPTADAWLRLMCRAVQHVAWFKYSPSSIALAALTLARFLCGKARRVWEETEDCFDIVDDLDTRLAKQINDLSEEQVKDLSEVRVKKYSYAFYSKAATFVVNIIPLPYHTNTLATVRRRHSDELDDSVSLARTPTFSAGVIRARPPNRDSAPIFFLGRLHKLGLFLRCCSCVLAAEPQLPLPLLDDPDLKLRRRDFAPVVRRIRSMQLWPQGFSRTQHRPVFEDLYTTANAKTKAKIDRGGIAIPRPREATRALCTVILTRHLLRVLDALPSARKPRRRPSPYSSHAPSQQRWPGPGFYSPALRWPSQRPPHARVVSPLRIPPASIGLLGPQAADRALFHRAGAPALDPQPRSSAPSVPATTARTSSFNKDTPPTDGFIFVQMLLVGVTHKLVAQKFHVQCSYSVLEANQLVTYCLGPEIQAIVCRSPDKQLRLLADLLFLRFYHQHDNGGAQQAQEHLFKTQMRWYRGFTPPQLSFLQDLSHHEDIHKPDAAHSDSELSDLSDLSDDEYDSEANYSCNSNSGSESESSLPRRNPSFIQRPRRIKALAVSWPAQSEGYDPYKRPYHWQEHIREFFFPDKHQPEEPRDKTPVVKDLVEMRKIQPKIYNTSEFYEALKESRLLDAFLDICKPGSLLQTSHPDVERSFRFHNWCSSHGEILVRWTPPTVIRQDLSPKLEYKAFDPIHFLKFFSSHPRMHPWTFNPMAAYMFITEAVFKFNCRTWLIACLEALTFEARSWDLHQVYRDLMGHKIMMNPQDHPILEQLEERLRTVILQTAYHRTLLDQVNLEILQPLRYAKLRYAELTPLQKLASSASSASRMVSTHDSIKRRAAHVLGATPREDRTKQAKKNQKQRLKRKATKAAAGTLKRETLGETSSTITNRPRLQNTCPGCSHKPEADWCIRTVYVRENKRAAEYEGYAVTSAAVGDRLRPKNPPQSKTGNKAKKSRIYKRPNYVSPSELQIRWYEARPADHPVWTDCRRDIIRFVHKRKSGDCMVGGVRFNALPPAILKLMQDNHALVRICALRRRADMQLWAYGSMTVKRAAAPDYETR
ncbi:hypothetical protein B0H16DRAFT_1454427 [Mycena metata]|uniref:Cyclin N-terminal domain-containing protein n=1 Tax=Mycena metata TaxID=1033252 RepID=A0AAD7JJJ3_9AGAR|nr:hypothetical protein B0H16DRAFT_1454427 [Mycena metata]